MDLALKIELPTLAIIALQFWVTISCPAQVRTERGGPVNGVAINATALRQFDVLYRQVNVHDISDTEYFQDVTMCRLRCDWDSRRFLAIVKRERFEFLAPDRTEAGERRLVQLQGIASTAGKTMVRDEDGLCGMTGDSLLRALQTREVLDIRKFGLTGFPRAFVEEQAPGSFEGHATYYPAAEFTVGSAVDGQYRVVHKLRDPQGEFNVEERWLFDVLSNMPRSYSVARKQTGKSDYLPDFRQEMSWQEKDGVYLPQEMSFVTSDVVQVGEKREDFKRYEVDTSFHFHWFEVNSDLDDALFSPAIIKDIRQIEELIDPVQSGADSISKLDRIRAQ